MLTPWYNTRIYYITYTIIPIFTLYQKHFNCVIQGKLFLLVSSTSLNDYGNQMKYNFLRGIKMICVLVHAIYLITVYDVYRYLVLTYKNKKYYNLKIFKWKCINSINIIYMKLHIYKQNIIIMRFMTMTHHYNNNMYM